LNAGLTEGSAILVGVINAAGGGLMRDVLVRDEPLLFKPGQFYVLAAFLGCLLFSVLAVQFKMEATKAAGIAIGTTFVIRVMAIQFNWKSHSLWKGPPVPKAPNQIKPASESSEPPRQIEP
jgi:uncharacterized membrane protein YeiH